MNPHALLGNNLFSPSQRFRNHRAKASCSSPALAFLSRNASFFSASLRVPNIKGSEAVRFDGPMTDFKELEDEEVEMVVETVITRTLPPALTLEHGIRSIKEAVEKLNAEPPCSTKGVWRFQVAVPPSPKALTWFCSQPESSGVFPRFFTSKETENPSCKQLFMNKTRGIFGIGAAIIFARSSSCAPSKHRLIRRYLSSDSIPIITYGFMDTDFDTGSSSIKHAAGAFYFVIPQIELDEHEDASILAATLAWDDAFCSFNQAVESFESSIYQVHTSCQVWPTTERFHSKCITSTPANANLAEDETFQMMSVNSLLLERLDHPEESFKLRGTLSCQFCFRLSPTIGVSRKMVCYPFNDFEKKIVLEQLLKTINELLKLPAASVDFQVLYEGQKSDFFFKYIR